MVDEISISLEETNRLRAQLGLKPIVGTNTNGDDVKKTANNEAAVAGKQKNGLPIEELQSRLKSVRAASINRASLTNNKDNDAWLQQVGKPHSHSKIEIEYGDEEEDTEKMEDELTTVNVELGFDRKLSGKDIILTLKDQDVKNDDDNVILHNEQLSTDKQINNAMQLKQMNRQRRQGRVPLNVSSFDVEKEDESQQYMRLAIDAESSVSELKGIESSVREGNKIRADLDQKGDESTVSSDFMPAKIKARKVKQKNEGRKRSKIQSVSVIKHPPAQDEDDSSSEDELQVTVDISSKPRDLVSKKEDMNSIALEVQREKEEKERRAKEIEYSNNISKRMVLNEGDQFLDSLRTKVLEMERPVAEKAFVSNERPQQMEIESVTAKVEDTQQPDFYDGLASTLQFLKRKADVNPQRTPSPLIVKSDVIENDLLDRRSKLIQDVQERIREQMANKELDLKEDQLEAYEAKEIEKAGSVLREEELKNYNPEVTLSYKDSKGNSLTTKEAYKQLSQKFHGTKSNKKKQAKFQSRVEARKKQGSNVFGTDI